MQLKDSHKAKIFCQLTRKCSKAILCEPLWSVIPHPSIATNVGAGVSVVDCFQLNRPAVRDELWHHKQHRANAHHTATWTQRNISHLSIDTIEDELQLDRTDGANYIVCICFNLGTANRTGWQHHQHPHFILPHEANQQSSLLTHSYPHRYPPLGAKVRDKDHSDYIANLIHGGDDASEGGGDLITLLNGSDDRVKVPWCECLLHSHQHRQKKDEDLWKDDKGKGESRTFTVTDSSVKHYVLLFTITSVTTEN